MTRNPGAREHRQAQLMRQWRVLIELSAHPAGRSLADLGRVAGIGGRTIRRDIETLAGAGFPISRVRLRGRPKFLLARPPTLPIAFDHDELAALALASHTVLSFPASPFHGPMTRAIAKIQGLAKADATDAFATAGTQLWGGVRRTRHYSDSEVWFRELTMAIRNRRTLRIRYYTLERDRTEEREIDPYGILLHDGAFYVIGYCHLRRARRTFLVNRIRFAKATGQSFVLPADFSLKDHFRNAWSIIRDKALVEVRIRFDKQVAPLIREGRWHESQKVADGPGGSVILTVQVTGWDEIKRWVLGFGGAAEALSPPELRKAIAEDLRALNTRY